MGRVSLDAGEPAGTPDMHETDAPIAVTRRGPEGGEARPGHAEGVAGLWADVVEALMDLQPLGAPAGAAGRERCA
jgi:hypothetical protein